jgi:site-specific DNA-methyltransferase (adenine-specific)
MACCDEGIQVTPYYQDDAVTIYHGDCRDVLSVVRADAVITDPPYGVGVSYGPSYDDSRPDYWDWLRERITLMRVSAPVVLFTHRVKALAELHDWDWIGVWNKPGAFGARVGNSPVLPHWEPVFMYGIHSIGTAGVFTTDVFTINPEKAGNVGVWIGREKWKNADMGTHPTPKPLGLYLRLINSFAAKTVIDPFMGSGTTLRAAKDLGRKAIGIEIEERYCEIAAKRCRQEVLPL